MKTKIIAESAYNHNGEVDYLKKLALATKNSNADYFTVQVMDVDTFCEKNYEKFEIYKNNSISFEGFEDVFNLCEENNTQVIPCVLDIKSFEFCKQFNFEIYKIHATDIVNKPFLEELSKHNYKYILETQCATYQDIKFATNILKEKIICLMHGFSNYPTEIEDIQINSLDSLKTYFPEYNIGFADHSLDTKTIPAMALAKGISYIEKHITLKREHNRFDWQVSLTPEEFKVFTSNMNLYQKALGINSKHPVKNELHYRNIIYKKYLGNNVFLRSDNGKDYLSHLFHSFPKNNVTIAVIARLKSTRLKKKVLKDVYGKPLIIQLINRLEKAKTPQNIILATSGLNEDEELRNLIINENKQSFVGHPVSVLDRMLSLAMEKQSGSIFRVTGDNLFTDPHLIDEMTKLLLENNLDYVRVNNVPFGISAELFSVSYLWNLYLNMDNPLNSEYLTWYVINDKKANKGVIKIDYEYDKIKYSNLSIDYQEDYDRSLKLIKKIGKKKFEDITLKEILDNTDYDDLISENKIIKLPNIDKMLLKNYLELLDNVNYKVTKNIKI